MSESFTLDELAPTEGASPESFTLEELAPTRKSSWEAAKSRFDAGTSDWRDLALLTDSDPETLRPPAWNDSSETTANRLEAAKQHYLRKSLEPRSQAQAQEASGDAASSYLLERLPFVRHATGWREARDVRQAQERINKAEVADPQDLLTVGRYLANEELAANRGIGRQAIDIATSLPTEAVEFYLLAGGGGPIAGASKTAGKAVGGGLKKLVPKALPGTAKVVEGIGYGIGLGSVAGLPRVPQGYEERRLRGQKPVPALVKSFVMSTAEMGAETLGAGPLVPAGKAVGKAVAKTGRAVVPKVVREAKVTQQLVAGLKKAWTKAKPGLEEIFTKKLDEIGINGVFGEILEERYPELVAGMLGEDAGVVGNVLEGDFQAAGTQLLVELLGIGMGVTAMNPRGIAKGAAILTGAEARRAQDHAALGRVEDLIDEDPAARQVLARGLGRRQFAKVTGLPGRMINRNLMARVQQRAEAANQTDEWREKHLEAAAKLSPRELAVKYGLRRDLSKATMLEQVAATLKVGDFAPETPATPVEPQLAPSPTAAVPPAKVAKGRPGEAPLAKFLPKRMGATTPDVPTTTPDVPPAIQPTVPVDVTPSARTTVPASSEELWRRDVDSGAFVGTHRDWRQYRDRVAGLATRVLTLDFANVDADQAEVVERTRNLVTAKQRPRVTPAMVSGVLDQMVASGILVATTDATGKPLIRLVARPPVAEGEALGEPASQARPIKPASAVRQPAPVAGEPVGPSEPMGLPQQAKQQALSLERPKEKVKPVSRRKIYRQSLRVLKAFRSNAPIRVGQFRGKYLGIFKPGVDVIRTATGENIDTIAHEIGHAIDQGWLGGPSRRKGKWPARLGTDRTNTWRAVPKAAFKELRELGKNLYGNTVPTAGYVGEGLAEFIRQRLIDPGFAAQHVPEFSKWFDEVFLPSAPEGARELAKLRDMYDRYSQQGPWERAKQGMVDPTSWEERWRRSWTNVRNWFSVAEHFEEFWPLKQMWEAAQERNPQIPKATPTQLYDEARSRRGTVSGRVHTMVYDTMIDPWGNPTGVRPLIAINPLVGKHGDEFMAYLWARRTIKLHEKNPKFASGMPLADAERIVADAKRDFPRFEEAARIYYEWNNGVLDYVADLSPDSREVITRIKLGDAGDYMPLERVFQEYDQLYETWGATNAQLASVAKRIHGSGRSIKTPMQTTINKAQRLLDYAHRRVLWEYTMAISDPKVGFQGMGEFFEEVSKDRVLKYATTLQELLKVINKRDGVQVETAEGVFDLKDFGKLVADANFAMDIVNFFGEQEFYHGFKPITTVRDHEGNLRWYEMREDIWRALMGRAAAVREATLLTQFKNGLAGAFKLQAKVWKAGTVGYRASFGLVSNFLFDMRSYIQNTRQRDPRAILINYAAALAEVAQDALVRSVGALDPTPSKTLKQAARRFVGDTPWMDLYRRLGLQLHRPMEQGTSTLAKAARDVAPRNHHWFDPRDFLGNMAELAKGTFGAAMEIAQVTEPIARLAEMRAAAKEVGWQPGQPMTPDQAIEISLGGKVITADFPAAGHFSRAANEYSPFYNARIAAHRASLAALKRDPVGYIAKALIQYTALGLGAWWLFSDEDWWPEISRRTRYGEWLPFTFTNPWNGETELARIPAGRDIPGHVSGLLIASLDQLSGKDKEAAREAIMALLLELNPASIPPSVKETIQQYANWDFYGQYPIEPERYKDTPGTQRYGPYTTEASKGIAKAMSLVFDESGPNVSYTSPIRIEHAIRGFLGPAPIDAARTIDKLGGKQAWAPAANWPLIGRFVSQGGPLGSDPLSTHRLFDAARRTRFRQRDQENPETDIERQQRLKLADAEQAVFALFRARAFSKNERFRREMTELAVTISRKALAEYQRPVPEGEFIPREEMREFRRKAQSFKKQALAGETQDNQ